MNVACVKFAGIKIPADKQVRFCARMWRRAFDETSECFDCATGRAADVVSPVAGRCSGSPFNHTGQCRCGALFQSKTKGGKYCKKCQKVELRAACTRWRMKQKAKRGD